MTDNDALRPPRDHDEIQAWLVERVALYLDMPAAEILPDLNFADHGLDSVYTFALCGEIEDELGLSIEPTLLWDIDTVAGLTDHLVGLAAN
jgi:acyl carrier protein